MNKIILKDKAIIEDLIYEVRGKQVMLDSELVSTKWRNCLKIYKVNKKYKNSISIVELNYI